MSNNNQDLIPLRKVHFCLVASGSLLLYLGSFMLFPYILSVSDGIWYYSVMFLCASIFLVINAGIDLS